MADKVLIVEDDSNLLEATKCNFRKEGYDVILWISHGEIRSPARISGTNVTATCLRSPLTAWHIARLEQWAHHILLQLLLS